MTKDLETIKNDLDNQLREVVSKLSKPKEKIWTGGEPIFLELAKTQNILDSAVFSQLKFIQSNLTEEEIIREIKPVIDRWVNHVRAWYY